MRVRISQYGSNDPLDILVSVPGHRPWAARLMAPLVGDGRDPQLLRWYFEDRLDSPGLDSDREAAAVAAMRDYGRQLWNQLFDTEDRSGAARGALAAGLEIVGPAPLQALHWELMRDPLDDAAPALRTPLVRMIVAEQAPPAPTSEGGPRVLLVTARPDGRDDVAYRTVSSQVAELVGPPATLRVVRPPTLGALARDLAQATADGGTFDIVHIDAHAELLSAAEIGRAFRFRCPGQRDFPGRRPFVLFETEHVGLIELVPTDTLGALLTEHGVSIVVLTACRSATATGQDLTSMCHHLAAAGVGSVLGMGHRVSVTAVEMLVAPLYRELLSGAPLSRAATLARQALAADPLRRAWFGRDITIEDWSLPVVYERMPARRLATGQGVPAAPLPPIEGRDLEVQALDRMLVRSERRHLMVRGMVGSGKSTLLAHLLAWWTRTGLAARNGYLSLAQPATGGAPAVIAAVLAAVGAPAGALKDSDLVLGVDDVDALLALPAAERRTVAAFFGSLTGGSLVVVYAARGSAAWLAPATFGTDVLSLGPLDPVTFGRLSTPTAGYQAPTLVSLTVEEALGGLPGVVTALTNRRPSERNTLLTALLGAAPDEPVELPEIESILAGLEPETRSCLPYLAPLVGPVPLNLVDPLTEHLPAHDELKYLNAALWELTEVGLALETAPGIVALHPLLAARLRSLPASRDRELAQAWSAVWLDAALGLWRSMHSVDEPGLRLQAWAVARDQLPNLENAVRIGLTAGQDVTMGLTVVVDVLDADRHWAQASVLAMVVSAGLRKADAPPHLIGAAVDLEAHALLQMGRVTEAERRYGDALALHSDDDELAASVHHQLGLIAQRRDLVVAERHYRRAVELAADGTGLVAGRAVQQLGRLAQERSEPALARELFARAREFFRAAGDQPAESSSLYQGAVAAQQDGDLAAALALCEEALGLRRLLADPTGAANCLHQMSVIQEKRGDLAAAVRDARGALKQYAREGYRPGEAATLLRLAELTLRGEPRRGPEADQLLAAGLEALGDADDATLRARLHSLRGRVLTELGRPAEAVAHSARALLIRSWFPQPVGNDAYWLHRQREALGDEAFDRKLAGALGPGPAAALRAELETAS